MTTSQMHKREKELVSRAFQLFRGIPHVHILADHVEDRLGIFSFYLDNVHYNLVVKLLNDLWGIQVRGGCACAGTYGHFLLNVTYEQSKRITEKINQGDLSEKPGWVRLSLHPTMTDEELEIVAGAVREIALYADRWKNDYIYNPRKNEFRHRSEPEDKIAKVLPWFRF